MITTAIKFVTLKGFISSVRPRSTRVHASELPAATTVEQQGMPTDYASFSVRTVPPAYGPLPWNRALPPSRIASALPKTAVGSRVFDKQSKSIKWPWRDAFFDVSNARELACNMDLRQ